MRKRGKTIRPKRDAVRIFEEQSKEREEAIERIVKATSKKPDDQAKLANDIKIAAQLFAFHSRARGVNSREFLLPLQIGSGAAQKDRRIKRIRKDIEKLAIAVRAHPLAMEALKGVVDFDKAAARLRLREEGWPRAVAQQRQGRQLTPHDRFVAYLARVFEARFAPAKAGFSRGEGARPKGPFIAFSEAVLAELGSPVDRQTIGRAFTRARAQRKPYRARTELVGQKT